MNKSIYLILALLMVAGLVSCTDENIGPSITDTRSTIYEDSSFTITGTTVANTRLQARTSTQLVGKLHNPGYGTLTSDVVCQLMPSNTIDTTGVLSIDSCRLTLCITTSNSSAFTGDSLAPMRMNVYALNKQLPNPIYSNFDPTGYYSPGDLLGSTVYSPKSAELQSSYSSSTYTTYYWKEVHVKLPQSFAQSMYDLYKSNREAFSDPDKFAAHYPGLYITNSYGNGRVMNYYATDIDVYYHQHVQLTDSTDTVYAAQRQSYVASTPEVVNNNNIKLEPDPKVQEMVAAGQAVVMGPAGYEVNVKFPIQEIIDKYRENTRNSLSLINTLELTIPVEKISNTYDVEPPAYLLMVKKGKKDAFFDGDSLTNDKDSFYAKYDKSTGTYVFSGMRKYLLNIIDNENGVASDDDINLTITPIDVSTYTTSNSSYYYYGGTKTTVTKIAPSVSQPCLGKLRLDKAKIKVVYTKQSAE